MDAVRYDPSAPIVFYISGLGGGKSFSLGVALVLLSTSLRNSTSLCVAPVFDTVANSTLPALMEAWRSMGLEEGVHYIVGHRPPREWGVRPYTALGNYRVLTWRWGGWVLFDGADHYDKHRGLELDMVAADEVRDMKPDALKVYMGRLRGKASRRAGIPSRFLGATTPPRDPSLLRSYREKSGVRFVRGRTADNRVHLPDGYEDLLRGIYDPRTFEREVEGKDVDLGGLPVYYMFRDAPWGEGGHIFPDVDVDPERELWLSFDFNASATKPMVCSAYQAHDVRDHGPVDVKVWEWVEFDARTPFFVSRIARDLDSWEFKGTLWVTGDHSGHARQSAADLTDYAHIIERLGRFVSPGRRLSMIRTRVTLSLHRRVESLNARLMTAEGRRLWAICERCTYGREDLLLTRWKESRTGKQELDQSTDPVRTHGSDTDSYFTYNKYPPEVSILRNK